MTRRYITIAVTLVALVFSTTAVFANASFDRSNAKEDQFFLRTSDIDAVVAQYGITVIRRHGSPSGDVWLVQAPEGSSPEAVLAAMKAAGSISGGETVELAGLPEINLEGYAASAAAVIHSSGTASTPCLDFHMSGTWSGYGAQAASALVHLEDAQRYGCGENVLVAVIDTWIDVEHSHLQGAVVPGYDFLNEVVSSAEERSKLDGGRQLAIIEESEMALVAGSAHPVQLANSVVLLGQSDSEAEAALQDLPGYYGHGTMTAGLIRMVSPGAQIMPLVAFDENGNGHPYDIIRAIYYAVDNGAHVINMSFSMHDKSRELYDALEYARANGVIPVAASGNRGNLEYAYPASFGNTIGVASTDWNDQLTEFTNYGILTADITAPGNELITFFPGGGYVVGWGTSFSTPLVAGTVALIRFRHNGSNKATHMNTRYDLLVGGVYHDYLWDYIYSGRRLDAYGAVRASL